MKGSKAQEGSLSLENYYAGNEWELRGSVGGEQLMAVGETLIRFDYRMHSTLTIDASADYGLS